MLIIRALVVDDYQEHVEILVNTLNMYGCEAAGCDSGAKALEICEETLPHLIVYDGLMECMRAWQFGARLNAKPRVGVRPYMVALTGFGSTLQRRLCEEHGFDKYCTKPIELFQILDWIKMARLRLQSAPKEPEEK